MALKAVLDQEAYDALSDALKAEYTQDGDSFYLDAEDIDSHPKVKNLKSAFEKTKRDAQQLRTQAEKWKDKDPDKYDELIAAAEKKEEQQALDKGEFDKLRDRLTAQHAKDIEKLNEKLAKREARIRRSVVDDALNAALADAKVEEHHRPAVRALLKERGLDVIEEDDDWKGVFKTDMGPVEIGEYVGTWAKSDEAAHYLPAPNKTGSGAVQSKGGGGKGATTFDRNDPLAWGGNLEAIAKGEATGA